MSTAENDMIIWFKKMNKDTVEERYRIKKRVYR